jgi:hypothetical protein
MYNNKFTPKMVKVKAGGDNFCYFYPGRATSMAHEMHSIACRSNRKQLGIEACMPLSRPRLVALLRLSI